MSKNLVLANQQEIDRPDTKQRNTHYCGIGYFSLLIIMAILAAVAIFGNEFGVFFKWYLVVLACGISCMPLSMLLMGRFRDSGWIVSKPVGIAVSSWLMWMLSSVRILKFSEVSCWVTLLLCFGINITVYILCTKKVKNEIRLFTDTGSTVNSILFSEFIFLALFIFWLYLKCFNPGAYGTEKSMDFGFMQAMFKSDYMAPEDLWLSGRPINYYYVGQFVATYLTKLSGVGVEYGYNLMLMLIAALGFSLPCSIASNAAETFSKDLLGCEKRKALFPYVAGGLAGVAVDFAGNFHYTLYAKIIPAMRELSGVDELAESVDYTYKSYWFPDATRYIGYNPDTADKTIHEFPVYSFVLGDLHAHVVNIIFVLCVVAILLGFMLRKKADLDRVRRCGEYLNCDRKGFWGFELSQIFDPAVIVIGFFIGFFHMTNFWDFPIYFVVSGAIILFVNATLYNFSLATLKLTLCHAVIVLAVSTITCLPFTIEFNQISTGIRLCENHTPFYQLMILWAIPLIIVTVFLFSLIYRKKLEGAFNDDSWVFAKKNKLFKFIGNLEVSELFILVLGLCAIGLVLLPEVIYVKDIYSGDYKRANTMFKLTYQAFIMFGIAMGYILPRLLFFGTYRTKVISGLMSVVFLTTVGYFGKSITSWFGDFSIGTSFDGGETIDSDATVSFIVLISSIFTAVSLLYVILKKKKTIVGISLTFCALAIALVMQAVLWFSIYRPSERNKGFNAGEYLLTVNYDDYLATNWINENIQGRPVMLEANGSSYTEYDRVSARTGLPTILGWYTHEWLWQSDSSCNLPEIVSTRQADVKTIYTTRYYDELKELIDEYNVSYIYVGGCEREAFPEINYDNLLALGSVVYPDNYDDSMKDCATYIIKVAE